MNKILATAAATTLLTIASGAATPSIAAEEPAVVPAAKALPAFFALSHTGYVYSAAFPAPAKKK